MKIAMTMATICVFSISAHAQNELTRKEIYRINCGAVVQIYANGGFSGVGFIVGGGIVMTANHVVTTRESRFTQYSSDLKVVIEGRGGSYPAAPVAPLVSNDQVNYDSAIIKIEFTDLPHVNLGTWNELDIGDGLVMLASFPGFGCIALEGTVAKKAPFITPLGPKPVNTVLFQAPVRNGFSGSPIFGRTGHVIGIEDTKVFGISIGLSDLRDKWIEAAKQGGGVWIQGVNVRDNFLELINNLDQNLISGLGSGVDIGYAKAEQESQK
jgi:S1-C subfamily serine protease